jgi:hypothetical protein
VGFEIGGWSFNLFDSGTAGLVHIGWHDLAAEDGCPMYDFHLFVRPGSWEWWIGGDEVVMVARHFGLGPLFLLAWIS